MYDVLVTPWDAPREQWRPFAGEAREFPLKGNSEAHQKARRLYENIKKRREHAEDVARAERDAQEAVVVAQQALEAERQRAANSGELSRLDAELLQKVKAAIADANPEIHNPRTARASELLRAAENEYLGFLRDHSVEFVQELAPEAEKVSQDFIALREEWAKKRRPVEQRWAELNDAARLLIGNDERFRASDLPEGIAFETPPFPAAALERIAADEKAHREAAEQTAEGNDLTGA